MRKILSLVIVLFSSLSMCGQHSNQRTSDTLIIYRNKKLPSDKIIEKKILGKWKDENSTTIFYRNKTYLVYFDKGEKQEGFWDINNGMLIFELFSPGGIIRSRGLQEIYVISDFDSSAMVYINPNDKIIWHAKKIKENK